MHKLIAAATICCISISSLGAKVPNNNAVFDPFAAWLVGSHNGTIPYVEVVNPGAPLTGDPFAAWLAAHGGKVKDDVHPALPQNHQSEPNLVGIHPAIWHELMPR
jgi:hypothetical protein